MTTWNHKTVIITGASSGIGKALALGLKGSGANIVLAARNIASLEDIAVELQAKGNKVLVQPTDVSKEEDCKVLIENTVKAFGTVHVLINNAGISMRALFAEVDLKVLEELMQVNFWGAVYCTKYALPWLLNSKGSVVGVSSIAGYKGLPGRTGYSASKFALQGFLETLRIENLKNNLHVLIACPGFTASNIRNTARSKDGSAQKESPLDESSLMSAEKTATHILHAIEKRKRTLILTAQGKLTVWLNKFVPKIVDTLVYNHMAKEQDSPFR
ncbi:MAG: SDR family oxidoreductase [Bacteroidales bacterium]